MADDPYTSLKMLNDAHGSNPLGFAGGDAVGEAFWVDVRDLFLYGDQFMNFYPDTPQYEGAGGTQPTGEANILMRPAANLERRYATTAEANALFAVGDRVFIRQDGVVNLNILGNQVDLTP